MRDGLSLLAREPLWREVFDQEGGCCVARGAQLDRGVGDDGAKARVKSTARGSARRVERGECSRVVLGAEMEVDVWSGRRRELRVRADEARSLTVSWAGEDELGVEAQSGLARRAETDVDLEASGKGRARVEDENEAREGGRRRQHHEQREAKWSGVEKSWFKVKARGEGRKEKAVPGQHCSGWPSQAARKADPERCRDCAPLLTIVLSGPMRSTSCSDKAV